MRTQATKTENGIQKFLEYGLQSLKQVLKAQKQQQQVDNIMERLKHCNQNQEASTTGNVYGIYDMSGGAWELSAAYLNTNNLTDGEIIKSTASYLKQIYSDDVSTGTSNENTVYQKNAEVYGDAVYEISNG